MVLWMLSSGVWLASGGMCESLLGFCRIFVVIVFSLFLNKNLFSLNLLSAAIYGVKF
jgi:hypothetical protein